MSIQKVNRGNKKWLTKGAKVTIMITKVTESEVRKR
nr:MAG TPA: Mitochondrial translation initiation factor [Caudoviricetes sp.]DAY96771.1 MAG TPA: Mitochondrial translation initiation factor [Caudoviricetes sp.]